MKLIFNARRHIEYFFAYDTLHHIYILSRVVLRSSRNPEKPSRSTKRNDSYIKPNSNCPSVPFDDVDDIVFEVLPSPIPQLTCSFDTTVTLDSNLQCEGKECIVSTVRVVEVLPGM